MLRIAYPVLFIGITALSVYNAYVTRVIHYEITLDKPIKPLRIGMASDLHLGKLFGGKELDKLADIMPVSYTHLLLKAKSNTGMYSVLKLKKSAIKARLSQH